MMFFYSTLHRLFRLVTYKTCKQKITKIYLLDQISMFKPNEKEILQFAVSAIGQNSIKQKMVIDCFLYFSFILFESYSVANRVTGRCNDKYFN